jgi:asparagine synthase (glutamine-hydrolysing)
MKAHFPKINRPFLSITKPHAQEPLISGTRIWSTQTLEAPSTLNRFSSWKINGARVTVQSDYSGHHPLYYYSSDSAFIVSDSLLKLLDLGVPTDLDEPALALFCRCGFFLNCRTPFKEIQATPPNANIIWDNGKLSVSGSPRIIPAQSHTPESAATNYADLFSQAVKRCYPNPETFDVLLSGGRDSRQILFELIQQNFKPRSCISGGNENDRYIAKQLAEKLNIPLVTVDSNARAMPQIWEKNTLTHMCALEHTWLSPMANYLKDNSPQAYEGTGVGVLTRSELLSSQYLDLLESDRFDELAELMTFNIGPTKSFFRNLSESWSFLYRNEDAALGLLVDELKRHREAANPLTSFNFWNWNRRATALWPLGLANQRTEIRTPFLDRDLYDFVASIPACVVLESEPQSGAIKTKFKKIGDIPHNDDIPNLPRQKSKLSLRAANWVDRTALVTQYSPKNLPLLFPREKNMTPRSKSMQFSVLQYLCQLSHICK